MSYIYPRCKCHSKIIPVYYWRDYHGHIPEDAVPAGETVYIGQALHDPAGLLPAAIYSGNPTIVLPYLGRALPSEVGAKILCSNEKDCFVWENVTNTNFSQLMVDKHLVVGGYEFGKKIYIGRTLYQGETVVGKVKGFGEDDTRFYFVHEGKEISISSYQVLTYVHI